MVHVIFSGHAADYFLGDVPEGFLELLVGHHIDNWVQSGVKVSYPEQTGDYTFWTGAIFSTDSGGEVPEKERKPTNEEGTHHHTQGDKRLVLLRKMSTT